MLSQRILNVIPADMLGMDFMTPGEDIGDPNTLEVRWQVRPHFDLVLPLRNSVTYYIDRFFSELAARMDRPLFERDEGMTSCNSCHIMNFVATSPTTW